MHKFIEHIVKMFSVLVLAMLMSSCSNTTTSETTVITGCTAFSLIYPSRADTEETKRQILAHNLTFEEVCSEVDKQTP